MKKIKKFFKKHYKRIITVFCVLISLLAFSINSFAFETSLGDPNNLSGMQIQKLKGNNSGTVTVRGTYPMAISVAPAYNSNINLKQSAVFAFDTNSETIVFSWNNYEGAFWPEKNGYVYFNFEFLFAGKSLKYDSVAGFKSRIRFTNGNYDDVTFDYSNVNVTVSNGTYPLLGYSSFVFNISGYFHVQAGYEYSNLQLALKFSSKEPASNTSFLIRKFNGFTFYDNINDIPFGNLSPSVDDSQKDILDKETQAEEDLSQIIGDNGEALQDALNPGDQSANEQVIMVHPLTVFINKIADSDYGGHEKIETLLHISLSVGMFAFIVSLASTIIGKTRS